MGHTPTGPHPAVAQAAREMLNKILENELSGVVSTAVACLGLYRDPVIALQRRPRRDPPRGAIVIHGAA